MAPLTIPDGPQRRRRPGAAVRRPEEHRRLASGPGRHAGKDRPARAPRRPRRASRGHRAIKECAHRSTSDRRRLGWSRRPPEPVPGARRGSAARSTTTLAYRTRATSHHRVGPRVPGAPGMVSGIAQVPSGRPNRAACGLACRLRLRGVGVGRRRADGIDPSELTGNHPAGSDRGARSDCEFAQSARVPASRGSDNARRAPASGSHTAISPGQVCPCPPFGPHAWAQPVGAQADASPRALQGPCIQCSRCPDERAADHRLCELGVQPALRADHEQCPAEPASGVHRRIDQFEHPTPARIWV
jgi:hypothetical protein